MTDLFEVAGTAQVDIDTKRIGVRFDHGSAEALTRFAAFVRTSARSSIRPARRMRIDELPPERQRIFEARLANAQSHGGPLPVLPKAPSRPGEPPRSPTGIFRDSILFDVDEDQGTAVIGPVALNGRSGRNIPSVLEFGGETDIHGHSVTIRPRPVMQPALERNLARMPALFEDLL